ncbi:DUF4287 domain-containing protein [Mesorhizobium sp. RP14(2022)]|uniref:DUF4287 domain-containing protein n=1 Tax=Mesorhizobium liriopis TaxID=2953882 RepID=A0ABT1C0B3_9HYPH|nr:DUF4287 domain-containing protein [Mesorhizobium liriopis]MCO6048265.1 DUF4287 domain-containing protein [Mesorhizobium liriopis]
MSETAKVKGPASYFPSIEKTYGKPIRHWQGLIRSQTALKHMQIVNWLKSEHGIGHGHANALVAATLAGETAGTNPLSSGGTDGSRS